MVKLTAPGTAESGGLYQAHADTGQPVVCPPGWLRRCSAPKENGSSCWISPETAPQVPATPDYEQGVVHRHMHVRPLLGEVREWLLDRQVFLLTFMNYIQQPHGPDPWNLAFGGAPQLTLHKSIKILLSTWLLFHRTWAHLSKAMFHFVSDSSAPDMSQAFNKC